MTPEQNQRIEQIRERRVGIAQFGPLSVGSTPGSHRSFVTVEGKVGLEANCGVASERNNAKAEFFANAPTDIDFLLSLVKSQEAGGDVRLWFNEWPTANGFYWLRGWRHYGDLPISVDGDSFWMMFNLARNHRTDLDDSEDVQFLGPITPYSAIGSATSMRCACVEKVREYGKKHQLCHPLRARAAIDLVEELESLSIEKQLAPPQ